MPERNQELTQNWKSIFMIFQCLKGHFDNTHNDITYNNFTYNNFTYKDITYNNFTQTLLTSTLLKKTIFITLNTGAITCNDFTYNINKCNITYMFLSTVISKVIYK